MPLYVGNNGVLCPSDSGTLEVGDCACDTVEPTGCCLTHRYYLDHPTYPTGSHPGTALWSGSIDVTRSQASSSPCANFSATYFINHSVGNARYNEGIACGATGSTATLTSPINTLFQRLCETAPGSGPGASYESEIRWNPLLSGQAYYLYFDFFGAGALLRMIAGFRGDGVLTSVFGSYTRPNPAWPGCAGSGCSPNLEGFAGALFTPTVSISGPGDFHREITMSTPGPVGATLNGFIPSQNYSYTFNGSVTGRWRPNPLIGAPPIVACPGFGGTFAALDGSPIIIPERPEPTTGCAGCGDDNREGLIG